VASRLNPYLNFADNARQAMEFYKGVFGGNLTFNTYGEYGAPDAPEADKIMHGMLETDKGLTLMGADNPPWDRAQSWKQHNGEPERRRRQRAARLLGEAVHGRHRVRPPRETDVGRRIRNVC